MARRHQSRRARNQAKWDAHASTHTTKVKALTTAHDTHPGLAGYAGGEAPVFATGSVSPVPHKPSVTQRKGISLKPFSDYIPGNPGDWTDRRSRGTVAAGPAVLKPHWSSDMPHRQAFDSEKSATRPAHEAVAMAADRASGGVEFITYGERHDSDKSAGLYRDGMGRIIRTTDMDDSMTTADYAAMYGVPMRRTRADMRDEAAADRATEAATKRANREAKRAQREQEKADRIQRRLERSAGKAGASHVSRRDMDEAARAVLAARGITEPTRQMMAAARDMIAHQKQVNEYVGGNA